MEAHSAATPYKYISYYYYGRSAGHAFLRLRKSRTNVDEGDTATCPIVVVRSRRAGGCGGGTCYYVSTSVRLTRSIPLQPLPSRIDHWSSPLLLSLLYVRLSAFLRPTDPVCFSVKRTLNKVPMFTAFVRFT